MSRFLLPSHGDKADRFLDLFSNMKRNASLMKRFHCSFFEEEGELLAYSFIFIKRCTTKPHQEISLWKERERGTERKKSIERTCRHHCCVIYYGCVCVWEREKLFWWEKNALCRRTSIQRTRKEKAREIINGKIEGGNRKKSWYVEQLSFARMYYDDWLCYYSATLVIRAQEERERKRNSP